MLTTNILEVNVNAVGRKTLQRIMRAFLLVVETRVVSKLLDESQLLVRANTTNNRKALLLGDLSNDLSDSTSRRADKDGLTLLGLANLVQTAPGSEAGHAQRTQEQRQIQVMRVVNLPHHARLRVLHARIFPNGHKRQHGVTLREVRVVALQNLGGDGVGHGLAQLEGGSVGLNAGVAHLAAHVRVVGGIEDGEDETAFGRGLNVEGDILDGEMLSRDGEAGGDLLVDEGLVWCHDECV